MSGLIGKKIGMTSIYDASGKIVPCTVLEAGPCVVTQVKTVEKDGYSAIQLGYDEKKEKKTILKRMLFTLTQILLKDNMFKQSMLIKTQMIFFVSTKAWMF